MKVAIILGRYLNDDGTICELLKKRLEMAIELYKDFSVQKIIVSGGIANKIAGVSEASQMKKYLVDNKIPEEDIILEEKSETTTENAVYSIPIAFKLEANLIIVCTTCEHFTARSYSVINIFEKEIQKNNMESELKKDIRLMIYTDCNETNKL